MARARSTELILGLLTPILGVIGFSIFMFAPIHTVGVSFLNRPTEIQHVSVFSESNGNAFSGSFLFEYAIVFLLTLVIATSAVVHATKRARAAAVVLGVSSALLWIGTYPNPQPSRISYIEVLAVIGPYLDGALACAVLATAIAIAVDVRDRPYHG